MTKSLLTAEDIKKFILNTIEDTKPREHSLVTKYQLCSILNISIYRMEKLIKLGLPHKKIGNKRKYKVKDVTRWLNNKNIEF